MFAVGREPTTSIVAVKRDILTIPPTFVEVARLFSAAGLSFTKLRTMASVISDRLIDLLMFIRFFLPLKTDKIF